MRAARTDRDLLRISFTRLSKLLAYSESTGTTLDEFPVLISFFFLSRYSCSWRNYRAIIEKLHCRNGLSLA